MTASLDLSMIDHAVNNQSNIRAAKTVGGRACLNLGTHIHHQHSFTVSGSERSGALNYTPSDSSAIDLTKARLAPRNDYFQKHSVVERIELISRLERSGLVRRPR